MGLRQCFKYLIAGGDKAIFASQESAEDDPKQAVHDLQKFEKETKGPIFYVGITCGLSATYIGAQLEYAMHLDRYVTALLGFNPVELARKIVVAGWTTTFFDVAQQQASMAIDPRWSSKRFVLLPVVGPEAVTGSTRMKGGSATLIALVPIFAAALSSIAVPQSKLSHTPSPPFHPSPPPAPSGESSQEPSGEASTLPSLQPLPQSSGPIPDCDSRPAQAANPVPISKPVEDGGGSGGRSNRNGDHLFSAEDGLVTTPAFTRAGEQINTDRCSSSRLDRPEPVVGLGVSWCLERFAEIMAQTYRNASSGIEHFALAAGHSLHHGCSVYYVGHNVCGIFGMIDASECPPTYGARLADVRGFLHGGWGALRNQDGDLSSDPASAPLPFSVEAFRTAVLPCVAPNDSVIFLWSSAVHSSVDALSESYVEEVRALRRQLERVSPFIGFISVNSTTGEESALDTPSNQLFGRMCNIFRRDALIHLELPQLDHLAQARSVGRPKQGEGPSEDHANNAVMSGGRTALLEELDLMYRCVALKLILNGISTCAHVLKGKVYRGYMVDLRISNVKLLHRSVSIIQRFFTNRSTQDCAFFILRSICRSETDEQLQEMLQTLYGPDQVAEGELARSLVSRGSKTEKVVPVALLLATGKFGLSAALEAIAKEPIVRRIMEGLC